MEENNGVNKIEEIKKRVAEIYKKSSEIHVSLNQKRKKVKAVKATITGVYGNFITLTSNVNGYEESFSISYIDLMLGNTAIEEMKQDI